MQYTTFTSLLHFIRGEVLAVFYLPKKNRNTAITKSEKNWNS